MTMSLSFLCRKTANFDFEPIFSYVNLSAGAARYNFPLKKIFFLPFFYHSILFLFKFVFFKATYIFYPLKLLHLGAGDDSSS